VLLKKYLSLFLTVAICLFEARPTLAADKKFFVGVAGNFSESSDNVSHPYGKHFRNAATMALDDYSEQLKKAHISIQLQEFDYGVGTEQVISAADKALKSDVIAVLGFVYSTHVLLVGDLFQKNETLLLTPTATADRIDELGKYIRRSCISDTLQADLLANAAKQAGIKRVAIIAAADCAYCQSLKNAFTKKFSDSGGEVSADIPTLLNDTDFKPTAEALKNKSYDAIFVPNYERPSALLVSTLLDQGIKPKLWLGGDAWGANGELFGKILANRNAKALTVVQWYNKSKDSEVAKFITRYRIKFGREPVDAAGLAYDGMRALLKALLNSKSKTKQDLATQIGLLGKFHGVTGEITFLPGKATPEKTATVLILEDGKKTIFDGRKI